MPNNSSSNVTINRPIANGNASPNVGQITRKLVKAANNGGREINERRGGVGTRLVNGQVFAQRKRLGERPTRINNNVVARCVGKRQTLKAGTHTMRVKLCPEQRQQVPMSINNNNNGWG